MRAGQTCAKIMRSASLLLPVSGSAIGAGSEPYVDVGPDNVAGSIPHRKLQRKVEQHLPRWSTSDINPP